MPKAILLQKLRRALRTVAAPDKIQPITGFRFGRRHMLRGLGITAGALTASSLPPSCFRGSSDASPSGRRVVVVGAGLAGLTVAYRLAQRGQLVELYDANSRLGGRAYTMHSNFTNKVELGGEFIDSDHHVIRNLVAELGLNLIDAEGASSRLEDERYFLRGQRWTETQMDELLEPIARKLREDRTAHGAGEASYLSAKPVHRELDRLSVSEWFHRNGFDGPARTMLELVCQSEGGREPSEQSYLNLLYQMSDDDGDEEGSGDERFVVKEGSGAIASRLESRVPRKVSFEHRLQSVRMRSDGRPEAIFDANGRTVHVVADKLVLAIPFTQLRKCELQGLSISPPQRRAIEQARYGTNSKLVVGMSSRPWVAQGASGESLSDEVYHGSYDASRGFSTKGAAMISFTGGNLGLAVGERDVRIQAERFAAKLDGTFPGARAAYDGNAVRMVWGTARYFEGSYMCYAPGEWTAFAGAEGLQAGNVHFAGEHTGRAKGFMEGAIDSGERVAAEILRSTG